MTDSLRESISALMDDEANEIEFRRVLSKLDDETTRNTWKRYQVVRAVMRKQAGDSLHIDISGEIASRIENEPLEPDSQVELSPNTNSINQSPSKNRLTRPLTSLAVAASVAFLVVFGVTQFEQNNNNAPAPVSVAEQKRIIPSPNNVIAAGTNGNRPEPQEITPGDLEHLSDAHKRLRVLINRHTQQADISLGQGVIPSAQLVTSDEPRGY